MFEIRTVLGCQRYSSSVHSGHRTGGWGRTQWEASGEAHGQVCQMSTECKEEAITERPGAVWFYTKQGLAGKSRQEPSPQNVNLENTQGPTINVDSPRR